MGLRDILYTAYARRLANDLDPQAIPRHVGVLVDGNRRWARERGARSFEGHQAGADNIANLLAWCEEVGVEVVTLWLLSTDNLTRPQDELAPLLGIIERTVDDLADTGRWRIRLVGALDLLPTVTADRLRGAVARTSEVTGMTVNVAVGYGGRREITDAVRGLLQEHASRGTSIEELAGMITVEHIAEHLYTKGQPDPDLVIRTSGEQRISDFMLWQSAHSEFYFMEALGPDLREVDFLRALRDFARRQRRFGQ